MKQLKISHSITARNEEMISQYLADISHYPLLSMEEEVELARRIKKGDQKAFEKLVCSNLRFVISVAKQYQHQGLTLGDLINEGNIGMMKAAERFDDTFGFKFISYAVWWIRQSITAALNEKGTVIRLPQSAISLGNHMKKLMDAFEQEHHRKPDANELSDILEIEEEKLVTTLFAPNHRVSADAPLSEDSDTTIVDGMTDDSAPATDSALDKESCQQEITVALNGLGERDRTIIVRLFGIGCQEETPDEVAMELGLSRERVRQLKEGAIKHLSASPNIHSLRKYL